MDGASIHAMAAPSGLEDRVSKVEERLTGLETQSARVDERTGLILGTVQRIEERVFRGHGDLGHQGGALDERRQARTELLKTSTLIFTALAALVAAAGVVLRSL